jgi:hypothetical protein
MSNWKIKTAKVVGWIVTSGVASFGLTTLLELVTALEISMPSKMMLAWAINLISYAIVQYKEEKDELES